MALALLAAASFTASSASAQTAFPGNAIYTGTAPAAVAVDSSGNVYVSDSTAVYKLTLSGSSYTQTTLITGLTNATGIALRGGNIYVADAGAEQIYETSTTGGPYQASGGLLTPASYVPGGVAVDGSGDVFFTSYYPASGTSRVYELYFGSPTPTLLSQFPVADGSVIQPAGVALDASGNLFVSYYNYDTGGEVEELPWTGNAWAASTVSAVYVSTSGTSYSGITIDANDNIYLADSGHNVVDEATFNGSGWNAPVPVATGFLNTPEGVALDGSGNLFISDTGNARVIKQTPSLNFGSVNVGSTSANPITLYFTFSSGGTIAAPAVLTQGAANLDFTDAGTGTCTTTNGPGNPYTANQTCSVVVNFKPQNPGLRMGAVELLNSSNAVIATAYVYGTGSGPQVNFLPGTESALSVTGTFTPTPTAVTVDAGGNVFVADPANGQVVKEPVSGPQVTVASGFTGVEGVAVDGAGNVYVADVGGLELYKVPFNGSTYGSPLPLFSYVPYAHGGVAVDGNGDVFFTSHSNYRNSLVYELFSSGAVTVLSQFPVADGSVIQPAGIALDASGNLFVSYYNYDSGHAVFELPRTGSAWAASTTAVDVSSNSGSASFAGIAIGADESIYLADSQNNQVLQLSWNGTGWNAPVAVTTSTLQSPEGVALDSKGNLYIGDTGDNRVLEEDYADPPSLAFATSLEGVTSGDSPQTVTLENVGNYALAVSSLAFGANPSSYSLTSTACLSGVPSGASCSLPIDFTPLSTSNPDTLTITDNIDYTAGSTQLIGLSGTGTPVTPTQVVFTSYSTPIAANTALGTVSANLEDGNGHTDINNTSSVTFTLTFPDSSMVQLIANAVGGVATVDFSSPLPIAGNYTLSASSGILASASTGIVVTPLSQAITFPNPTPVVNGSPVTLTATSSSGLTVTYSIISGPGSVVGSTFTSTGTGNVVVEADQGGNQTYSAAPPVQDTIVVNAAPAAYTAPTKPVGTPSAPQTAIITFTAPATLGSISVVTQGASGLDYACANGGNCSSPANGGTCTIGTSYTAGQACTVDYTFDPTAPGARNGAILLYDNSGPPANLVGTSYITGIGAGPLANFLPGTESTLPIVGTLSPTAVAVDASGNVYFADPLNGDVIKETPSGNTYNQSVVASGFTNHVAGVAVDGAGNVYIADPGATELYEVLWNGSSYGTATSLLTPGNYAPGGVAVDGSENLYFTSSLNNGTSNVYEMTPGGSPTAFSQFPTADQSVIQPAGITLDAAGNLFVSYYNYDSGHAVFELPWTGNAWAASTTAVDVSSNSGSASFAGIAVGADENIYLADAQNNVVEEAIWNGTNWSAPVTVTTSTLSSPEGIALDASGSLYIGDTNNGRVVKENYLNPPTLSFASTNVGSNSSDSPQTVTLINAGNDPLSGDPLTLSSLFPTNTSYLLTGSTCTAATLLEPGNSCAVAVTFDPRAAGPQPGDVAITDNSLNVGTASQSIPLSGTANAIAPTVATVSAVSVPYGSTTGVLVTATESGTVGTTDGGVVTFGDTTGGGSFIPSTCTLASGFCTATYYPSGAVNVGTYTADITASFAANNNYSLATSASNLTITSVAPSVATVSAVSAPAGSTAGVLVTAIESGTAGSTNGGIVTFGTAGGVGGSFNPTFCTLAGGSCTTTYYPSGTVNVGTYTNDITASFAANNNYSLATAANNLAITAIAPTVATVSTVSSLHGTTAGVLVTATESGTAGTTNGGIVTFGDTAGGGTFNPTSCTLASGSCTTTYMPSGTLAAGTYANDITASFAANNNYSAASASNTLFIASQPQVITFTPPSPVVPTATPITLTAAGGGSGNPIIFSYVSGPGTLSGPNNDTLTVTGTGNIVIDAIQAGNASYAQGFAQATVVVTSTPIYNVSNPTSVGSSENGSATITFTSDPTIGSIEVVTQGILGSTVNSGGITNGTETEFQYAAGGSCTIGGSYNIGNACTVSYTFNPAAPGIRRGAILIYDNASPANLVATTYLSGIGQSPLAVASPGIMSTFAGNGTQGSTGDGGPATSAEFHYPNIAAVDAAGNVYVADYFNNRVRLICSSAPPAYVGACAAGNIITIAGGGASPATCTGSIDAIGDGCVATGAAINGPWGLALDGAGNVYISDVLDNVIRKVSSSTGIITTVAGGGSSPATCAGSTDLVGDGCTATAATLSSPYGLAVDASGNVYIADSGNYRIRIVSSFSGAIFSIAGNGTPGSTGDGGLATNAQLGTDYGLTLDTFGNVYFADGSANHIREISSSNGYINTVVGGGSSPATCTGSTDSIGDGCTATNASLNTPVGVVVDAAGDIYVADSGDNRIREVAAATNIITTVAGGGASPATCAFSTDAIGDGCAATSASLSTPVGIALGNFDNLYISDATNNRIREVTNTAAPLQFGSLDVLSSSTPQTFTVGNAGNISLALSSLTLLDTTDYSLTGSVCTSSTILLTGANCGVTVTFIPQSAAVLNSSISINNNSLNSGSASLYVGLFGTGFGITTTTLPNPTVGVLYNQALTSVGGIAPLTWAITAGSLPAGVTLNTSTGVLNGTPTEAGLFTFTVTVTDSTSPTPLTYSQNYTFTSEPPNIVVPLTLPQMTVGTYYQYSLAATGGTAPYTYTLVSGNLPAGIYLNAGPAGLLSGTAITGGTYTFTIQTTDSSTAIAPFTAPFSVNTTYNITVGPQPSAFVSPTSINFSTVPTGTTGNAWTVTLNNTTGTPMLITKWVLSDPDFTYSTTCPSAGGILYGNSTCNIYISFSPLTTGSFNGTLTIFDSAIQGSQTISLSGTSTSSSPTVFVTPTNIPFSSQPVGTTGNSWTVTVNNTSAFLLNINSIVLTDPTDFVLNSGCGSTLGPNSTCNLTVAFSPQSVGNLSGAIVITDNATPSGTQTVTLSGTGTSNTPTILISPTNIPFTSQPVGTTGNSWTVTISNTSAFLVTGLSIGLSDAADFQLSSGCGSTLAPYSTCNLTVAFSPQFVGNINGVIIIHDNAVNSPQTVTLNGIGTSDQPTILVSPGNIPFSDQVIGTTGNPWTITVSNTSAFPVTGLSINLTDAVDFQLTSGCGSVLGPYTTCNLTVAFSPHSVGSLSGAIQIFDNAVNSPQTVTLNGYGDPIPVNVQISPGSIPFSSQAENTTSNPWTVNFSNMSGTAVNISSIAITGDPTDFMETNACGSVLGAYSSCTILVYFTPQSVNSFSANLVVTSSGNPSVLTVPLSGSSTGPPVGPGYSLSVNPSNLTVVAGQPASTMFTFTPVGGFVGTVDFSCTGLPAGATCSFNPPSVTATGNNVVQISTLTVTTTASGTAIISENNANSEPTLAAFFFLPSLLLGSFIAWRRKSFTTRVRGLLFLLLVGMVVVGGVAGCTGATPQATPLGSHVVTVVAHASAGSSSSSSSVTASFTLNVIQ